MPTAKEVRTGIFLYLLLTLLFSSVFYYFIISAKSLSAGHGLYVLGLMWSPGLAALVTRLVRQRNLRGQGWGWGGTRYQLLAYSVPLAYAAAVYIPVWLLGGGEFNHVYLERLALRMGTPASFPALTFLIFFLWQATVGVFFSCLSALGEEIGWRGYLVPELARLTTFTRTTLLSSTIWAVWHYPVILFADYRSSTPVWYALACFTLMVFGISFLFNWLRLRSGSLWTGMFLHATHNLFIQGIFDPMTVDTGRTAYLIGEFGIGLVITGGLVGFLCWRKRNQLPDVSLREPAAS